jgi:phage major head subunit gpT-like protein
MALVTADFLAGLMTNFQAVFAQAYGQYEKEALYKALCLEIDSNAAFEQLGWLEAVPGMSEWKDERKVWGLTPKDYKITNLDWEDTICVDRNTLADDKYGMILPRVRQLAQRAADHPAKRIFELLNDGETEKTYDGTAFFADTRSFGDSGNIDNLLAGAYSADATKIRAGITAAVKAMMAFKDNRGEFMNLQPDILICHPTMVVDIRNALIPAVAATTRAEAEFIKRIIVRSELSGNSGKNYILACTTDTLKPVVLQIRQKPQFNALDSPKSENVFMRKHIYYGADYRGNVALGEPRCAVLVKPSD